MLSQWFMIFVVLFWKQTFQQLDAGLEKYETSLSKDENAPAISSQNPIESKLMEEIQETVMMEKQDNEEDQSADLLSESDELLFYSESDELVCQGDEICEEGDKVTAIERRTEFGSLCEFPMEYDNQTHYDCFWGIDGREFCKVDGFIYVCEPLWPDHDHELEAALEEEELKENVPKPTQNQVIERYTVKGQKCELPKWYNGRYLTDCLYISSTRELCYANTKWQYCEPLKPPSPTPTLTQIAAKRRFTVSGKMCTLPFVHLGKEYNDCIQLSGGKQWCRLDNTWQECKPTYQDEESMQELHAEAYAPGFDVIASQTENQNKKQGSNNGAVIGISVLLALLLMTSVGLGIGMYMIRCSIVEIQRSQETGQFQMS